MKHIGGPARSGDELEADRQATQARIQVALGKRRPTPRAKPVERCGEQDGMGHTCTLDKGHEGYHADTENGYRNC